MYVFESFYCVSKYKYIYSVSLFSLVNLKWDDILLHRYLYSQYNEQQVSIMQFSTTVLSVTSHIILFNYWVLHTFSKKHTFITHTEICVRNSRQSSQQCDVGKTAIIHGMVYASTFRSLALHKVTRNNSTHTVL